MSIDRNTIRFWVIDMDLNVRATETLQNGEVVISGSSSDLVKLGRWLVRGESGEVIAPTQPDGIYKINLKKIKFILDDVTMRKKIKLSILNDALIVEIGLVVARTLGEALQDFFDEPVERMTHFHLDSFDDFYMEECSTTLTFLYY